MDDKKRKEELEELFRQSQGVLEQLQSYGSLDGEGLEEIYNVLQASAITGAEEDEELRFAAEMESYTLADYQNAFDAQEADDAFEEYQQRKSLLAEIKKLKPQAEKIAAQEKKYELFLDVYRAYEKDHPSGKMADFVASLGGDFSRIENVKEEKFDPEKYSAMNGQDLFEEYKRLGKIIEEDDMEKNPYSFPYLPDYKEYQVERKAAAYKSALAVEENPSEFVAPNKGKAVDFGAQFGGQNSQGKTRVI